MCEMGGSLDNKSGTKFGFQSRSLKAAYYLRRAGYRVSYVQVGCRGRWRRGREGQRGAGGECRRLGAACCLRRAGYRVSDVQVGTLGAGRGRRGEGAGRRDREGGERGRERGMGRGGEGGGVADTVRGCMLRLSGSGTLP